MSIEISYGELKLEFPNKEALSRWCEEQTELFGDMVVSLRNNQPTLAKALFAKVVVEESAFRDTGSIGGYGNSPVLPPITDESIGRYLAGVKELDHDVFANLAKHWHEFGRGDLPTNGNLRASQIVAIQAIVNARLANLNPMVSQVDTRLEEADHVRQSLEHVKAVFEEHMSLKGPVDYWTKKGEGHATARANHISTAKKALGAFLLVAIGFPLVFVFWLAPHLSEIAVNSTELSMLQLSLPFLGLYFLLISTGLWGLRVLMKLFLSEHHLQNDANERKTMVMTYLALTEKGSASDTDRSIVLGSLFRPTQDGVVKDEGFDGSLQNSIAKSFIK